MNLTNWQKVLESLKEPIVFIPLSVPFLIVLFSYIVVVGKLFSFRSYSPEKAHKALRHLTNPMPIIASVVIGGIIGWVAMSTQPANEFAILDKLIIIGVYLVIFLPSPALHIFTPILLKRRISKIENASRKTAKMRNRSK